MKGVKGAGVAKKKGHKKKDKHPDQPDPQATHAAAAATSFANAILSENNGNSLSDDVQPPSAGKADDQDKDQQLSEDEQREEQSEKELRGTASRKTEAERRHEERRRKRVSQL